MFSANYVFLVVAVIFSRRFLASIEYRVRTEGTAAIRRQHRFSVTRVELVWRAEIFYVF